MTFPLPHSGGWQDPAGCPSCLVRNPPHLPRGFHPFPQAEVDDGEDEEEAEEQLPADPPDVIQTPGFLNLQDLPPAGREQAQPQTSIPRAPQEHSHLRACSQGRAQLPPSTSTHSRVKLLGRGPGEVGPGHVALPKVVGAVRGVPGVVTAGPGQGAREGGVEVVESPGNDGVVVEGDVEADDADGKADAWEGQGWAQPWDTAWSSGVTWAGGVSPLKMGQMRFQMGMAPVLWNCPRASSM